MKERYEGTEPEKIRRQLKALGRRIKKEMPKGWGFTLLMFSYGEGGNMVYMSSAQRSDMVKAMLEFVEKVKEDE